MVKCALCHATFSSKQKLVLHFGDAHSVAKQRSRRSKVTEAVKRIAAEEDEEEPREESLKEDDSAFITSTRQPLPCSECGEQFATRASLQGHQCSTGSNKKQPVSCQYCGQKCKDKRGAAIHLAFCEQRYKNDAISEHSHVLESNPKPVESMDTYYECPGEDCGAIFKNQDQLAKHVQKHHSGEGIMVIRSSSPTNSPVFSHTPQIELPAVTPPQKSTQQPLVTVTMKPHVGKTEGLQDLSLLITPTKGMEETPGFPESVTADCSLSGDQGLEKDPPTITVEECRALETGINGNGEAVLYVAEDGTLLETSQRSIQSTKNEFHNILGQKETLVFFSNSNTKKQDSERELTCQICQQQFLKKKEFSLHIRNSHNISEKEETPYIKKEPIDSDDDRLVADDVDEDWELVTVGKRKKNGADLKIEKGKFEYKCKLCRRNFLSELGYQTHVRNKECKNKKFKLTRMFSCHFQRCDSSFFKLTELQRHWQIAHKFSMASKNLEFKDERAFTQWLVEEEEKYKVRFTCDVRRRKSHRTERLLVCHRFHHLRTAAARKAAKQEYSDKHNWIHKIKPCLCFARMKVYQDFDKETCDFTGKISVVYYYEHSHSDEDSQEEKTEILEHILQRNKRNRQNQFQDLKGNDKLMHRQKLEKFARLAGKEYRSTARTTKMDSVKRFKQEPDELPILNEYDEDQIAAANVANNLLESDELFTTQVEMVLDGQFDMGQEVLTGPVVNNLDGLTIFEGNRVEHINCKSDDLRNHEDDTETDEDSQTLQVVLPASTADWGKLFEMVRTRITTEHNPTIKAEAALVLPYEKVIELITPNEQIPIFRQLWELAYPTNQSEEEIEFEIRMVR